MNTDNIKIESYKKYLIFLLVIFCFVGIPASILSYSAYVFFKTKEDQFYYYLKYDMNRLTNELRNNILAEKYFCRFFHDYNLEELNKPDSNIEDSINFCKNLKNYYGKHIDFIVLTNEAEIKYNSSLDLRHSQTEWFEAYSYIKSNNGFFLNSDKINKGNINSVKKILGPQFVKESLKSLYNENDYSLIWGDSSGVIPPSGVYTMNWGGIFVFISNELLKDLSHLKFNILEYSANKDFVVGLYNSKDIDQNFWCSKKINNLEEIKRVLKESEIEGKNNVITGENYICHQFLTQGKAVFAFAEKKNTTLAIILKILLILFVYFLLSTPIIKYSWNTIVLKLPGNASIPLKLGFLFLFASGIPLLSLAVVTYQYQLQKRMTMIEEARAWSSENLLGLEQRFLSYLKKVRIELDAFIDNWVPGLKTPELSIDHIQKLGNKLKHYDVLDFFLVASESSIICSYDGIIKYKGSVDSVIFDKQDSILSREVSDYRYYELKHINIILKKLCSDLNNKPIPGNVLNKIEVFAESVMQKSFSEIIYNIIESFDSIREFGFGSKSNMSYFKLISLYEKSLNDYILIVSWLPHKIQRNFVEDIIPNANRNPRKFKFIAYDKTNRIFIPSEYKGNNELERFARRAIEKPTEEVEIININGEEYVAVAFLGRNLYEFSFVGLYPMSNINAVIDYKSHILGLLGVFCLILSVGLAHLLTKNFVNPMHTLQEGALAIENRNFNHRITNLNIDEFGEVGSIFNNVMVGLKELEIARFVQESLFPKPEFKQGKFSIYGKSVTMIDVGGDYLDFFKVDDNSFSVLLGDVAGHGLGAAVIMAMAKSAILVAENLHSPAAVLNHLHKMILATKSAKQRKIMTFQYLHVNSETGENLYSNAGACSPWLIRHSEHSVQELKMAGAALGAFKRAVYKEMPLDFRPGDAIVFYTDGIVECKDKNGEMLGYDRLKQLLLDSWAENPEDYYKNIYKAYLDFVGADAEAGDDLTFVILMYNDKVES